MTLNTFLQSNPIAKKESDQAIQKAFNQGIIEGRKPEITAAIQAERERVMSLVSIIGIPHVVNKIKNALFSDLSRPDNTSVKQPKKQSNSEPKKTNSPGGVRSPEGQKRLKDKILRGENK